MSCSGTSRLTEWMTTVVRSSSIERSVTFGQKVRSFAWSSGKLASVTARDPHERLAAVLAVQHPDERGRRVLEPVRHVFAPADLPLGHPAGEPHGALVEA